MDNAALPDQRSIGAGKHTSEPKGLKSCHEQPLAIPYSFFGPVNAVDAIVWIDVFVASLSRT